MRIIRSRSLSSTKGQYGLNIRDQFQTITMYEITVKDGCIRGMRLANICITEISTGICLHCGFWHKLLARCTENGSGQLPVLCIFVIVYKSNKKTKANSVSFCFSALSSLSTLFVALTHKPIHFLHLYKFFKMGHKYMISFFY